MCKKKKQNGYKWTFASVGGQVRVKIQSGADIAHLGELDRKLWTVLSCPVTGLEFDSKTLGYLDTDGDGKIRVDEVIAAAQWLTKVLNDPDLLLKGESVIPLSAFNTEDEEGATLQGSARQILSNLKLEKEEIALEDTVDKVKIFADTKFNGDGIITPASTDDAALKALIENIVKLIGSATDRSGVEGVTADHIEAFYAACADFAAWRKAAADGAAEIFPYGDDTAAAYDACNALKAKIADYFMRCKLIGFDGNLSEAVDISTEKILAVSGSDLSGGVAEIESSPLARPSAEGLLPLGAGINPAWQGAFASLKSLILDKKFPKAEAITEAQWNEVVASFGAYAAWLGEKKGDAVESLGEEAVGAILKEDRKADLLAVVEADKALEAEALSIEKVDKLTHLYRDFFKYLNNYVSFTDFYSKKKDKKAIFQAGRLYIDQRSTDLCVRIADMGKVSELSGYSGMYILICACHSKVKAASMNIAAVLTAGDIDGLRVGKNAVFYDRDGVDWDAVVVNIIDNPLSVRQAFWDPYRKVGKWINDKINKGAAEKNDKAFASMTATADSAAAQPKEAGAAVKSTFDIAKFAGIFAAIGMALGFLGSALASLVKGAVSIGPWKVLLVILAIMLVISGPAMFIAWRKLRRRDLGPLLNANGWAINAKSLVRVKFGRTLTSLAKYPKLTAVDKKARRRAWIRRIVWTLVILALGALTFCYFTGRLGKYSRPWPKKPATEQTDPGTDSTLVNGAVPPSDTVSVAALPDAPDAA